MLMKSLLFIVASFTAFLSSGLKAQNREQALAIHDKISIQVAGIGPEDATYINHVYTIGGDGLINLPLINKVKADGMKPSDLARKIEELFKAGEIYSHPSVIVSVDTPGVTDRLLYVSGEVIKTGAIPFREGMSVSKAITTAAGPNTFANMKAVKLKRKGVVIRTLNLSKAGSSDGDVLVEPEDEIIVPP